MASVRSALASVTQAISTISDRLSGADIVRQDHEAQTEAQRRMAARVSALRAGFSAIRERHDELSGRLSALRTGRA